MKKKFLALFAALTLSITPVYADLPDISGLSLEELQELQQIVNKAVFDNGGNIRLSKGYYVVGVDLMPGSYVLTAPEDVIASAIGIFANIDSYKEHESDLTYTAVRLDEFAQSMTTVYAGKDARITVEDGEVIYISTEMSIASGKLAIAP